MCENERTIARLIQEHPGRRLWFYLRDEEDRERFVAELKPLQPWLSNGDAEGIGPEDMGSFMAFGDDRRLAYVSNLCWFGTLRCGDEKFIHIDYGKFRRGERNFRIARRG